MASAAPALTAPVSAPPPPPVASSRLVALRQWLTARIADIISFETALICLIYFPDIKSAAGAGQMGTGLLVAFSGVCFAGAIGLLVRGKIRLRKDAGVLLGLWFGFVGWTIISMAWSPSVIASQRAVMMLLSMSTCTLACTAFVVSPDPQRARRYYMGVLLMGLWLAYASFLTYRTVLSGNVSTVNIKALGLNYLILGRAIGAAALVCAYYALYAKWRWQLRILTGVGATVLSGVMLLLGGRSPLVATVLCLMMLIAGAMRRARSVRGLLMQVMAALAVIVLTAFAAAKLAGVASALTSLQRLEFLLQRGFEHNDRYEIYQETWRSLDESPIFGHGLGSWAMRMGWGDRHLHAHNIFLEIWFDSGLPGLLLLFAMWWWVLHRYWPPARWLKLPYAPLALVMFINALMGALTSGDYTEQWWLYANMAMLLVVPLAKPLPASGPVTVAPPAGLTTAGQPR